MKTWLEVENWYFPLALFVLILTLGLFPTFEWSGQFFGGGVVREWVFNQVALPITPTDQRYSVLSWWQSSSYFEETALYALFAINVFVGLLPIIYSVMKFKIELANWYTVRVFESKQKIIKGK